MSSGWSCDVDRVVKLASNDTYCCRTVWMLRPPPNFSVLWWCFLFSRSGTEVLVLFLCAVWHSRCSQTDLSTLHSTLGQLFKPRGCHLTWGGVTEYGVWENLATAKGLWPRIHSKPTLSQCELILMVLSGTACVASFHPWFLGSRHTVYILVCTSTPMVPVNAVCNTLAQAGVVPCHHCRVFSAHTKFSVPTET